MKTRPKVKLESIDSLLGLEGTDGTVELSIKEIQGFKNHPFKVLDDEYMGDLVDSIQSFGVLTPVLVRPIDDGYEMISGHRRMHAATIAGLETIPAIIKEMDDDDAICFMVDANIQREELLPSEKAFAFKMKMEAMNRQGKRTDLTNETHMSSTDEIGKEVGISGRQVKRYIRLTELITELLDLVDSKKLSFVIGVELSYLEKQVQGWIYTCIQEGIIISSEQIELLRKRQEEGTITQAAVMAIIMRKPSVVTKRNISISEKKLSSYFPDNYSKKDIEEVIYKLLETWKENLGKE